MKQISFLFTLLLLVACNAKKDIDKINAGDIDHAMSLKQTSILKLKHIFQPDARITIGNVNKVLTCDSMCYIVDIGMGKVTIVNQNGELINEIDRKGRGNNEYLSLDDVFIDSEKQELNLLSRGNQKIYVWNLKGDKLTRTISVPKHFCSMTKTQDGYIGYMGNYTEDSSEPYNFFMLDNNMSIKKGAVKINPDTESRYNKDISVFSTSGNTVSFVQEYDYNIYRLEGDTPYIAYNIDFKNYAWPESQRLFVDNPIEQLTLDAQYIKKIQRIQETPKHLILFYNRQGQGYMSVCNKENNTSTCFVLTEGVKDLFPAPFGEIAGSDEHSILCTIDAEAIHDLYRGKNEHNDFDEMYKDKMEAFRLNVGDVNYNNPNPYIIIYSIEE